MGAYKDVGMYRPLRIKAKSETRRRLYKTKWNFLAINLKERGKTYNGSRIWFHFATRLSTGTSAVFVVVSGLYTVTKNILFLMKYFLMFGTLTARSTKQKIEKYQVIKEFGFNNKHEPVTSTRCLDSSRDCLPCDLAI
jgi:hypothetical protein